MVRFNEDIVLNGTSAESMRARTDTLAMMRAALDAVDPFSAVSSALGFENLSLRVMDREFPVAPYARFYLISFGKAAEAMTRAACGIMDFEDGICITNAPSSQWIGEIRVVKASHPLPDESGTAAAKEAGDIVKKCDEHDVLMVLVSGGGSSLLSLPVVPLLDMRKTTELLLRSGCDIKELNAVRKHLSQINGGRLAAACKGLVVSLILSDIVGDPLDMIASGPTVPDTTTFLDAKGILMKYDLWEKVPISVKEQISGGISGTVPESPKEGDACFEKVHSFIVANNAMACRAACDAAKKRGYACDIISSGLTGDARHAALTLLRYAENESGKQEPEEGRLPLAFVSGGETTVKVTGHGKGGRNQELVLGAVKELSGRRYLLASFGTDGIDGPTDAAGAMADGDTLSRAQEARLDADAHLSDNDAYGFFEALDELIFTGPTGTNVMDIQILLEY